MNLQDITKQEKISLIIASLGTGLCTIGFINQYIKFKKREKNKEKIKALRVYRPNEIRKKLLQSDQGISNQFQQIDTNIIKGETILIQGIGIANEPIKSVFNYRYQKLIHRKFTTVKKYSNEGFFKNCHIMPQSKADVLRYMNKHLDKVQQETVDSFVIRDPMVDRNDNKVYDLQDYICEVQIKGQDKNKKTTLKILDSCIDYLSSSRREKKLSFIKEFLFGFLSVFQVIIWPINIIFSGRPFIKGVEIGSENYEVGIESGKVITVLGDLVYDFSTNKLSLENPQYLMRDRRGILEYFQKKINQNVNNLLLVSIPLLCFATATAVIIHDVKKRQIKKTKEKKFKDMQNLEETNPNIPDEMRCVICVDKARSIILKPCMHTLMCTQCLKMVQNDSNKCPICKVNIEDYIQILVDNKN